MVTVTQDNTECVDCMNGHSSESGWYFTVDVTLNRNYACIEEWKVLEGYELQLCSITKTDKTSSLEN